MQLAPFLADALVGEIQILFFMVGILKEKNPNIIFRGKNILIKFNYHFSWQVQHLVKFGMIAGAQKVVFFNRK